MSWFLYSKNFNFPIRSTNNKDANTAKVQVEKTICDMIYARTMEHSTRSVSKVTYRSQIQHREVSSTRRPWGTHHRPLHSFSFSFHLRSNYYSQRESNTEPRKCTYASAHECVDILEQPTYSYISLYSYYHMRMQNMPSSSRKRPHRQLVSFS